MVENESVSNDNNDITERITELTEELRRLDIQRTQAAYKLKELIEEQSKSSQTPKEDENPPNGQVVTEQRLQQATKDRHGNLIVLGDRVRFLTKGLYRSTEGIVSKINKTRITAKDNKGILISRSPYNVEVIALSE